MFNIKRHPVTLVVVVATVVYLLQALLVAPDQMALARYNLSVNQAKVLTLLVAVPYIAVWLVALRSYSRLKKYSDTIKSYAKDSKAVKLITTGIAYLTIYFPLSALASTALAAISRAHPEFLANSVRIENYINLLLVVPVYLYLSKGGQAMVSVTNTRKKAPSQRLTMFYILFCAAYVTLILQDPARRLPAHGLPTATYYLPDLLLVATVAMPLLILWFLGLQAIQNLYYYRQKVSGTIYRVAVDPLLVGLTINITALIVLRCIQSASTALSHLGLGLIFALIYVSLGVILWGYILMGRGSKHLQKIEEI